MKNTKTNSAVEYEVFIPLVNLLLFNTTETPKFKEDFENLSEEFVSVNHFYKEADPKNEKYLEKNILYFLNNLEIENRKQIKEIIINSEVFIFSLMIKKIFENEATKCMENSLNELNEFSNQGKITNSIYSFINYQMKDIFEYDFSQMKVITNLQYDNLIYELCNPKKQL